MNDVVDLVTSESPPLRNSVDDIVKRGQRVQRRRRGGFAAASAVALTMLGVTAAVTVPQLAGHKSGTASSPAAGVVTQNFTYPTGAFTFGFDGYRVGKLKVADPIDVSTAYQIAPVYADGFANNGVPKNEPSLYAYLTVYRPGAYDSTKLVNPKHVTIGGHPGLQVVGTGEVDDIYVTTLAWEYSPSAWAVISSYSSRQNSPSTTQIQKLAAGLSDAAPAPATVPFKMSYVPAGYVLDEVGSHAMAGLNGVAAATDGDYAGAILSKPALPTTGLTEPYGGVDGNDPPGSFEIFVTPAANSNQHPSPGVSCLTGFCNKWADNGTVDVQVASGGRLSNAEMTKILNGITLDNVHNDGTWTPVTVAIP